MKWLVNTAGKPDSQLTLQLVWHAMGIALVLFSAVQAAFQGNEVPQHVWLFVLAGMGVQTAGYVKRRGQEGGKP